MALIDDLMHRDPESNWGLRTMVNIPARKAAIFWNDGDDLLVVELGTDRGAGFHKSGGACWGFWQQASANELWFRLMQQAINLMTCHGIAPEKVHAEFKKIPEYRALLPPDHEDLLRNDERHLLEKQLPNIGKGYVNFGTDDLVEYED